MTFASILEYKDADFDNCTIIANLRTYAKLNPVQSTRGHIMSNTNDQLSRRDQLLIESYKEQTAAWKHEDTLFYRFTSIILPLSIAALAVPYLEEKVPDLLAVIGGLTLMTFWGILCQIADAKSKVRFSIINEIEKGWDVPSHKDFEGRRDDTYGKKLKIHFLRCCTLWVYLVIVALLTLCRLHGSCTTQKVLITVTFDSIVIGSFWIIAAGIAAWAMCKTRKEVYPKSKDKTDSPRNGNRQ